MYFNLGALLRSRLTIHVFREQKPYTIAATALHLYLMVAGCWLLVGEG
jgi:hypothetical protein